MHAAAGLALPAPRRQQPQWQRPGSRPARKRLHIQACHRCLLERQQGLIAPPPPSLPAAGRGPVLAAALKHDAEAARQAEHAAQQPGQPPAEQEQQEDSPGVRAALAMLKFYKAAISPLLPPACRYLPTCSVYSMEAFKRFGVSRGFVLTAWRLMRCGPWGSKGYDPVRWPPPGLEPVFGGGGGDDDSGGSDNGSGNSPP